MTHSVNGNIVVCGRLKGYNRNLLNLVVANFMVNLYSNYSAKYDLEVITYTNTIINSDQNEPIIRVFNHQIRLFDFKPNIEELDKKNISLLIEVQSGSHVSISDTRYSSEIYNTFIEGRCSKISVKGKEIGFLGEVSPYVLEAWGLSYPVCAMEINLRELFDLF